MSIASAISDCAAPVEICIRAPSTAGANSSTLGVPSAPNRFAFSRPGSWACSGSRRSELLRTACWSAMRSVSASASL